jgi:D-amino-acid dehydrogenase
MGHILIIGGGVVGAACAWYLRRAGAEVIIMDQGPWGRGASHGNCGYVCPSHVLPLAIPGAIASTLKAMLRPGSPFYIKPRLDPALWGWLLQFARRCTPTAMMAAARGLHALLQSSRRLYDELTAEEGFDCDWQPRGLLVVFRSHQALEHHGQSAELLRREFGLISEPWSSGELSNREPALKPGLAGGWFYPDDAHLRPDRLMKSWQRRLLTAGVEIREQCAVRGFALKDGRVVGVRTAAGPVRADAVVIAAGAWTPLVARDLGVRLPIQPGKGYSITMPRPRNCPRLPLIFEEHRVAVTPLSDAYRLGSTMEFAGYDATLNRRRLELLRAGARHYLQEPEAEPVYEEWFGWRPMTYDSLPIIDALPRHGNVWVAAGHGMLGVSLATGTGKLLAERLLGRPPHVDPAPYGLQRLGIQ